MGRSLPITLQKSARCAFRLNPQTMNPIKSEAELIKAAQSGDSQAFDRLVLYYQEYLYRLMVRACHHPDDAEEVAVEAFARAYEKLEQFEGRSSFVTWLGRIATNLCFRRREKPEIPTLSLDDSSSSEGPHTLEPGDLRPGPEQQLMREEMRRIIRGSISTLPEPDQTVLRLRDIDGLSTEDTARQTGLTESAVKARLHRARKALRARLNADFLA